MKRALKVKKRRSEVGTDIRYMEYYMHNGFKEYGYTLTREIEKSSFKVEAYVSHSEKYVYYVCDFFDNLSDDEIARCNEIFTVSMKEESELIPFDDMPKHKNARTDVFYMSNHSDAYEQPPVIETGESILDTGIKTVFCNVGHSYMVEVINYGGRSKGIEIVFEADKITGLHVKLENAMIYWYESTGKVSEEITFVKKGRTYTCSLPDFEINPGRNPLSAVWCRSYKKYNNMCYYIAFTPTGFLNMPVEGILTVKPMCGKGVSVELGGIKSF